MYGLIHGFCHVTVGRRRVDDALRMNDLGDSSAEVELESLIGLPDSTSEAFPNRGYGSRSRDTSVGNGVSLPFSRAAWKLSI